MGENYVRLENYEMLKALYDFEANFAKTLSFQENDYFVLYQANTKQKNWWQIVNKAGQVGYIPSNYVTTVKVQPQFLIDFLDECLHMLKSSESQPEGSITINKQELILRLTERKRQAELGRKPKKQAPMPPDFGNTTPDKDENPSFVKSNQVKSAPSNASYVTAQMTMREVEKTEHKAKIEKNEAKNEKRRHSLPRQTKSEVFRQSSKIHESASQNNFRSSSNEPPLSPVKSRSASLVDVNSRTAYLLLDEVRRTTQLSYEMSKVAVTIVVSGLRQILPEHLGHYFEAVLHQLQVPLNASKMTVEETYDANRLNVIFTELTSCKEDSQQRSWMLHEDESIIVEYIKELTSILTNADAHVTRHVLRQDQYEGVATLIQYYQMEPRWTIRQLLLQSFGVMSSLDPVILTIMLNSILPMELARDMRSNSRNEPKLNYSALLLTMIFSMGEPMPITHLEQLGPDFMAFLLDLIEEPPDTDLEDRIPELFVNLILSYNLQFTTSENIVINTLKERTIAKTFTEKILLLLNREDDPVRIFDHEPAPPDSVLKIFIDLFSTDETASLFYTNDVKVLIDIILRQLMDVAPGEKRRQYLELCRRVLRTSGYKEHRHRSEDVLKCFTRIFCEESSESQEDQKLVREISNEFPQLFKM